MFKKISIRLSVIAFLAIAAIFTTVKISSAVTLTPTSATPAPQTPFRQINSQYNLYPAPPGPVNILLSDRRGPGYSLTLTKDGQPVSDYSQYKFHWLSSNIRSVIITCASGILCSKREVNLRPVKEGSSIISVRVTNGTRTVAYGELTVNVVSSLPSGTPTTTISTTPTATISATGGPTLTPTPTLPAITLPSYLFDLNDDGKVDEVDLNILLTGFAKRNGD